MGSTTLRLQMIKQKIQQYVNIVRSWFGLKPLPRKLLAKYTTEYTDNLTALHGIDIENEIAKSLAIEIRKEIDTDMVNQIIFDYSVLVRTNNKYRRKSLFDVMQDSRTSDVTMMMRLRKPQWCRICKH